MLGNVVAKSIRDRYLSVVVGGVGIVVLLYFGTLVYRDVDVSFYNELPLPILEIVGVADLTNVSSLVFSSMFNLGGALTMAGLAISIGAGTVAGEEEKGTMGLLLGNPRSRSHVYSAKTAALVLLMILGAVLLLGGGLSNAALFELDMTDVAVDALTIHMFVNSLFYGFLALAVGAWTGNRTLASGAAATVMLVSYLAANILPLTGTLDWLARFFPWFYFSGSNPITNGVAWGDLAVLMTGVVILFALGFVGLNRRDLRDRGVTAKLIDRLRTQPMTQKIADRIAGSARVSSIWVKTTSEHQGILVVTALVVVYLGILVGPLFALIPEGFREIISQFPDALIAMIGSADMSTPEGFYQAELYSIVAPIAFIVLTATMGARSIAGEEENHTMDLLMGNPIRRSRVISEKTLAMVVFAIVLGIVTFAAVWAGSLLGGLGIDPLKIGGTTMLLILLALVFGGVALAVSAGTGRTRLAVYAASGLAIVTYFTNSFLPLSENYAGWARWSLFHYYLSGDPLRSGLDWGNAAVLALIFVGLVALSYPLLQRRDLRN